MSEEELTAICQTIDGRTIDTEQEKAHVGPGPLSLVFGELGSRERNFDKSSFLGLKPAGVSLGQKARSSRCQGVRGKPAAA